MIRSTVLIASCIVAISGCSNSTTSSANFVENNVEAAITDSVAQKVLGIGAISIYPFAANNLNTPGIYAIDDKQFPGRDSYFKICNFDMGLDPIKNMNIVETNRERRVEDSLSAERISVALPFVTLKTQYTMQSIEGYKTKTVESGGSLDAADWIIENTGPNCKKIIDRKITNSEPFFVVTAVASSNLIEVVKGGGVDIAPFNIGVANIEVVVSDTGTRAVNEERVFAIAGKLYRDGKVTNHGRF
ncbi:MAG: hypothetical protein AAF826_03640 [Pseudomonadota bacterium]